VQVFYQIQNYDQGAATLLHDSKMAIGQFYSTQYQSGTIYSLNVNNNQIKAILKRAFNIIFTCTTGVE